MTTEPPNHQTIFILRACMEYLGAIKFVFLRIITIIRDGLADIIYSGQRSQLNNIIFYDFLCFFMLETIML